MNSAAPATEGSTIPSGSKTIIQWFTLRRMALGATIFGLFAAIESTAQGLGIVTAFPDPAQRTKIIYGLASNPALGLFYGDRHADIITPAGYMVYRILPALSLIGAIWALMFITKMLRGNEENGRWELLLAGQTTAPRATARTIIGAGSGITIAYGVVVLLLALIGRSPKFNLPFGGVLFYGLAIMAGPLIALSIGALTSQLMATRRRAVMYGLAPIIAFFILHSVGNVIDSLAWLKDLTPFGWIDDLHPFYHSQPLWLLPLALFSLLCCSVAVWLANKRDLGESLIPDNDAAKPKFALLNSQLGFDFRLTRNVLGGWLAGSIGFAVLIAAIDKTVAQSLSGANIVTRTFSKIAGNQYAHVELTYLGAAGFLTVIVLMVLATTYVGAIREEEGAGRLENLLSGNITRRHWLTARLALLISVAVVIVVVSNLTLWFIATPQGVTVDLGSLLFGSLNILGPAMFVLGVGILLYGLAPRLATIGMYALIAWSFTIDILASALNLNKYVADSSLLHHISLVPAASPHWVSFWVLTVSGTTLLFIGLVAFQWRDLVAE